jgi:prepilin-type N-terminal cleavage/methylation domain-containing protein
MNMRISPSRNNSGGFTLIEVLVSMTVLGLMMVGVAQMMNSAMSATLGSYKHMDADTEARMVLDRIAFDIAKITKRADVDYYFQKGTGNDQMAFYSESGGYYPSGVTTTTPESNVSLVGYRINSSNQLERLSKALVWNGVTSSTSGAAGLTSTDKAMAFLPQTIASTWPLVEGAGADPDYQVIGEQVFRLEYCFLVQNKFTTAPAITATTATLSDSPYASPDTTINGLQDVVAVVVSIAVLDSQSRAIVSPTTLQTAASNLSDVNGGTIANNGLPSTVWKTKLLSTGLGLPKAAATQVRIYQRYCYINHVQ